MWLSDWLNRDLFAGHERDRANVPLERVKEISLATVALAPPAEGLVDSENSLGRIQRAIRTRAPTTQTEEIASRGFDHEGGWRRLNPSHGFALVTCHQVLHRNTVRAQRYSATRLVEEIFAFAKNANVQSYL